jgi:predicted DNA-binding ribbon-helix-helix protein
MTLENDNDLAKSEIGLYLQFSPLSKKNIVINKKNTSITLEPIFWDALREISKNYGCSVSNLCQWIKEKKHPDSPLTSAIRVFVMSYYRLNK